LKRKTGGHPKAVVGNPRKRRLESGDGDGNKENRVVHSKKAKIPKELEIHERSGNKHQSKASGRKREALRALELN
jgi:hypothetical protein